VQYVNDRGKQNAIHPEFVASNFNKLLVKDTRLKVDTGMYCGWIAHYSDETSKIKCWVHLFTVHGERYASRHWGINYKYLRDVL
jgi:hypothetical protein